LSQHGAQQKMRAVPCLEPRDAAEHRLKPITILDQSAGWEEIEM